MRFTKFKKLTAVVMSAVMAVGSFAGAYANDEGVYVKEGSYNFTSFDNSGIPGEDSYVYRDDCFMRSSFLGCDHLCQLSVQVAAASMSYNAPEENGLEIDSSDDSKYITEMLTDIGFEDVDVNTYYTVDKYINTMGVAVGHRTITQDGKDYTLLAIVPRSAFYKAEWAGNFGLGEGDYHEGFKAARDEILRFVKQYMADYGIEGALKVWISGYSRGAAVANAVGGFFAGGGIAYFGDAYSIAPEDVYCYTYGTPSLLKNGASKDEVLSVAGARELDSYENDTPGEAFEYTGGGTIDPEGEEFGGIWNFVASYDFLAMLPPEDWGYLRYGSTMSFDEDLGVSTDDMLAILEEIGPGVYEGYRTLDYRNFEYYTLGLDGPGVVPDESGPANEGMGAFFRQRVAGMASLIGGNEEYANGLYQMSLMCAALLFGDMLPLFSGTELEEIDLSEAEPEKTLALVVLSYVSERVQEEGIADNDADAMLYALAELVESYLGIQIDTENITVDQLAAIAAKVIADDENLSTVIAAAIADGLDEGTADMAKMFLGLFSKRYTAGEEVTLEEILESFLYALAYGAEEGSAMSADTTYSTPEGVRVLLYSLIPTLVPELDYDLFKTIVGTNTYGNLDGSNTVKDAVKNILLILYTFYDEEGEVDYEAEDLGDAADYALMMFLGALVDNYSDAMSDIYGEDFVTEIAAADIFLTLTMSEFRQAVSYLVFADAGEAYSSAATIRNATTLLLSGGAIPYAHYVEGYISWAKALAGSESALGTHEPEKEEPAPAPAAAPAENKPNTGDGFAVEIYAFAALAMLGVIAYGKRKEE